VKASRVLYAAAVAVFVSGMIVAVFGVRTRYACGDEPTFTTSFQVADAACNPRGLSPELAPRQAPKSDHRWGERVAIAFGSFLVMVVLFRLASRPDDLQAGREALLAGLGRWGHEDVAMDRGRSGTIRARIGVLVYSVDRLANRDRPGRYRRYPVAEGAASRQGDLVT
jgi:hypothetical protein